MHAFEDAWRLLDKNKYVSKLSEALGEPVALSIRYYHGADVSVSVIDKDNRTKSSFRLLQFPGCCAFCISTGTEISAAWRGKKISYILQEIKEDLARGSGYAGIFATIVKGNAAQEKVLPNSGFTLLQAASDKVNPKTNNTISTYFKSLT